jgi:hypothetical protein
LRPSVKLNSLACLFLKVSKLTLGLNCAGGGGELKRLVLAIEVLLLVAGRAELERELPTLSFELLGTN